MGFKDYCKEKKENSHAKQEFTEKQKEDIEGIYNKFKDKSQDELISELFKNVESQKQNGTFNYDGLINTINKLSPFLTKEQNLKIEDILKSIK